MTATAAPKTLHIARKLMSLLGKIQITDDAGNVLYESRARWGWLSQPWSITQDGREVAAVTRKLWSFTPIWNVSTNEENFILRGKLWSWRRQITVVGGRFDGAMLRGSLLDMDFELARHGQVIARAQAKVMTLRTRHSIDLLDTTPQAELLTAILMTHLLAQKREDNRMGAAEQHSVHL
ncbi:hypothetical protein [Janthinobacterium sp. J1-1]|uniref:hypothetical protein n=1 Tax=Janthinobacterium sp. J1-1 TaxID=3065910 RepID=UPI002811C7BB|nr:hypothetical protein [Janthinobacterium sp. J1-1]